MTVRFVALVGQRSRPSSASALALFCLREFRGIRLLRTVLILPMVITPVVVGIVFRLIYASDVGMLTALSEAWAARPCRSSATRRAFVGLVASTSGSGRR